MLRIRPSHLMLVLTQIVAFLIAFDSEAQPLVSSELFRVIPPSPNAASLGKFADTPVGYYTGTPNVSIPLFEISEGEVTVPIRLDYHAGGVRVEETASSVGLGWALQAGGVITRVKRGLVDEQTVEQIPWITSLYQVPPTPDAYTYREYWGLAADGTLDTEPDLFYFNFLGRAGQMFFGNNGTVYLKPYQKLKVTPYWTITDEQGNQYTFAKTETTQHSATCVPGPPPEASVPYVSAWYLTEIRPFNTIGKIEFEYDTYEETTPVYDYQTIASSTRYVILEESGVVGPGGVRNADCMNRIFLFNPARLKRIKSTNFMVEFVYGEERCDLKGDYILKEVHYKRKETDESYTTLRVYRFKQKYLDGGTLRDLDFPCSPTQPLVDQIDYNKRLMLLGVDEISPAGEPGQRYTLEYYLDESNTGLPSRLSYNQDHWGFYNGAANDGRNDRTLIPASSDHPDGAYRECNLTAALGGSLRAINYPTGGRTEFQYELHDIYNRGNVKFETVTPKLATLGIVPSTQSFGQITMSQPFHVSSVKSSVRVRFEAGFPTDCSSTICDGESGNPFCNDYFNFELWKYSGSDSILVRRIYFNNYAQPSMPLDTGTYKIGHIVQVPTTVYHEAFCHPYTFSLNWYNSAYKDVTEIGGLRIRKITDIPGGPNSEKMVRIFSYRDGEQSSGTALSFPLYSYDVEEDFRIKYQFGVDGGSRKSRVFTSTSSQPLGSTQGSPVGYSQVIVYHGEDETNNILGTNGKTVYRFTDPYTYPDRQSFMQTSDIPTYSMLPTYPFAPVDSHDWLRGLLLESVDYSRDGENFKVKRRIKNQYTYFKNRFELSSWKVGASKTLYSYELLPGTGLVLSSWDFLPPIQRTFAPVPFKIRTGYNELHKTEEFIYDDSDATRFTVTTTDYVYSNDHLQVIEKTVTLSDGKVATTRMKYPSDFTSATTDDPDPASAALAKMKEANRIAVPVENRKLINGKLLGGTLIKFKEFPQKGIFPHEIYDYRTPTPLSGRPESKVENGNLVIETLSNGIGYEETAVFHDYNAKGGVLSLRRSNSPVVSYLWDFRETLPVAEVINADHSDVAYTGFESDGKGNWSFTPNYSEEKFSGLASYQVSPSRSITKSDLNANGKYIVSFWARSGIPTVNGITPITGQTVSGWTYCELLVSGVTSVTIGGNGLIDELRLYPASASMRTYTHLPGVGIISTSDPNGMPVFYEYDGLGRLKEQKDHNGDISRVYDYNYKITE